MDPVMLAVIGAGPKAAAVAARVAALHVWHRRRGSAIAAPRLHIFERSGRAGAHWYGEDGYTDGAQEVCTAPELDLVAGAPTLGEALELTPYTWSSFARTRGITAPIASHRQLADYIAWAIDVAIEQSSRAIVLDVDTEVTGIRRDGERWAITTRAASDRPTREHAARFDGVIVTSPGPALRRFHVEPRIANRIGDARSYWSEHRDAVHRSVASGHRVAVIGAGGAAAAICVDALHAVDPASEGGIVIVAPQPTLFTRGDSRYENTILTSRDAWKSLPRGARRQVAEHLISGVVFGRVLDQLEALDHQPAFMPARAVAAIAHGDAIGLWCLSLDDKTLLLEIDRVIDASGFDPLWFADLLDEPARTILRRLGIPVLADHLDPNLRLIVEAPMYDDETIREVLISAMPGLHVPFLAGGSQPPGRASLLQLGRTAAEILSAYLR